MTEDYYREQAALCATEAEETTLPRVAARLRRSEQAWLDLAGRCAHHAEIRRARQADLALAASLPVS